MHVRFTSFLAAFALLAGAELFGQNSAPASAAPEPIVPPAAADSAPLPESLPDPFSAGGDAAGMQMMAGYSKAVQAIKVIGMGRSASGVAEAILSLPDKSVLHVRIGERFTFVFGNGMSLPCEVASIEPQEIGLRVNGKTELRLR